MQRTARMASSAALACVVFGVSLFHAPAVLADEPAQAVPSKEADASDDPASNPRREEARVRFNRGVELFDEKEYERALIEFERSYELASLYQVLYNIGRVELALHRYARAVKAFERYLADGGDAIPETRIADVRRELKTARAHTAMILIRVKQPGADILLDGAPLDTSPMDSPALVDSGSRMLTVRKKGFQESSRVIALAWGDATTVDFDLEPTSRVERLVVEKHVDNGPNRAPMWIAWGATGVLTVGAGVSGLLALNAASDLDRAKATPGSTNDQRGDLADRATTFAAVSTMLSVGAIVAAGAAVYFTLKPPTKTPNYVLAPGGLYGRF